MLRNNSPLPEILLWKKLRNKQLGCKFRRQYSVEKFILDFYCPKLKIAIEIDGDDHFNLKSKLKDIWRQKIIEAYGIKFLRFNNNEITKNIDGVLETIIKEINPH